MKENLEDIRKVWDNIIDYEKNWMTTHSGANVPTCKIIEYFGVSTICELFGCSVSSETIARELVLEAFK